MRFLLLLFFCFFSTISYAAWPDKTISIVVGSQVGDGPDLIARIIAANLQEKLHQTVIVENKPGAGSLIATNYVIKSNPDGYTILLNSVNLAVITQSLKSANFDINEVLIPLIPMANPIIVIATKYGKYKDFQDFFDKNKSKQITYASLGVGSYGYYLYEHLLSLSGQDRLNIPFKFTSEAINQLLADRIDLSSSSFQAVKGLYDAKQIDILAITDNERSRFLPNTPTLKELGYPQIRLSSWTGLFVPINTPKDVVNKLYQILSEIKSSKEFNDDLEKISIEPFPKLSSEEFKSIIKNDQLYYKELMKELRIESK